MSFLTLLRRAAAAIGLASALVVAANAGPGPGGTGSDLPDIGTPADAVLTPQEEYQIGSMIVR